MRTCPKCRSHSRAYLRHPTYGMVYFCDDCKVEGEIITQATELLREVRSCSPLCWYYGSDNEKFIAICSELEARAHQ